jgi:cephalosporin-C deacetylase
MFVDLPLRELRTYRPDVPEPADFAVFWHEQLTEVRSRPLEAVFAPVDVGLRTVDVFDVSFAGHGGGRVHGWLLLPRHREAPLPSVVEFVAYGGGRGLPHEWLTWSAAGYAHLVMDTRGQGSSWRSGDTPDSGDVGAPAAPGYLTRGVGDPRTYYYLRVFVDAVRAVDAARDHEAIDPERVAVAGKSQGGGIALAAAHLADRPAAVMSDVPFLANVQRAVEITREEPYQELIQYCRTHRDEVDAAFHTLSYFDVVNHARRATAPAFFSVPSLTRRSRFGWSAGFPKTCLSLHPQHVVV